LCGAKDTEAPVAKLGVIVLNLFQNDLGMDMALDWKSLFSGNGRIDRTTFWTVQLLLALFGACMKATATLFPSEPMLAMLLLLLIASWVVGIFNLTKRLHDLSRSGWWMLVPMAIAVLVVGVAVTKFGRGSDGAIASEGLALLAPLAFFVTTGVLKGSPGPNRFGEPPKTLPSAAS
jgi:uncharacterized membrane protein YhaH (DUF805 family)